MPLGTRRASWWDTLRLQLFVSLPVVLAGLVAPTRWYLAWRCRHDAGRATMRFLASLREKYGCELLWTWFPLRRTLLVLAPEAIEAVLASKDNAGDPAIKKRALSRFAPGSVIVSSGGEWEERRPFNEAVLDFGTLHRHHEAFGAVVAREVGQVVAGELRFPQFQALGQRISQQVILGALRPDMNAQLACLLARSNLLLRDRKRFAALYRELEGALSEPGAECLVADAAARDAPAAVPVAPQIAFWMFVLKDAIELHVPRTLALIAAHPEVQRRARDEVRGKAALTAKAVSALPYLDACLREQLRLWTPVPLLLRRATTTFDLREGVRVAREQQILVHAGFYHRDPRVFAQADRFAPDAAMGTFPATYFFSAHRQGCAGRSLVTFVLTATLAMLLARFRFELQGPAIDTARIAYLYDHFALTLRAVGD
ncbi:MAG: cytochrome P450 [Burkholderiales bacterium]|nr:cytochrome P450 [Burkholderiales bacterium]